VSGSYSEDEDGSDNCMVVDEGEQDFTNRADRQMFGPEDDRTSLKLRDSNDETDAEPLQRLSLNVPLQVYVCAVYTESFMNRTRPLGGLCY
ncbi:hypothetical protein Tco_0240200, partial [Tanacetum coccineum]